MCNVDKMRVVKQLLFLIEFYYRFWIDVNKVIDRLYLRNYKDVKCKENYNFDVFKELIFKLNTLVAEQIFIWVVRFKKIFGVMLKSYFLFFYYRMVVRRNRYIEKCYKNNV